ncbi:hypothetical protein [Snodgrassella alvi]|nr:hypothetical protein [Snodgrassella alvi]
MVGGVAIGGVFANESADGVACEAVDDFGGAAGSKVNGATV